MVAKIKSGKSLKGALLYNERKVAVGKANLLDVRGYYKDAEKLRFEEKLYRLTDLAERNQRVKTNTFHVSLNFDPAEKLNKDQLTCIAENYMSAIGFSEQPYLIYQHHDSAHPHIHIVSTNIDAEGKRISLHNLGRTKSETARKMIEEDFGLVKADHKKAHLKPVGKLQPVRYGQDVSKQSVAAILTEITRLYRFTSLPELNAILNGLNILADRGSKSSTMFRQNGLRYWILDKEGMKTGVPIKASSLSGKPTMKLLEQRFKLNEALRKPLKDKLKVKVEMALTQSPGLDQFIKNLKRQEVEAIIRQNAEGLIYGLTLVDHRLKAVFNGSDLGKAYSASAIIARFSPNENAEKTAYVKSNTPHTRDFVHVFKNKDLSKTSGLLNELLEPDHLLQNEHLNMFKKKKKKRKKVNL